MVRLLNFCFIAIRFTSVITSLKPNPILLVEDDEAIRDTMKDYLESEGYPVITAKNGMDGLNLMRNGLRPSFVLVDLLMPIMDGWEFLFVKSHDQKFENIPVAVLTAAQMPQDKMKAALNKADIILKKPIDLGELMRAVREYCGSPAA